MYSSTRFGRLVLWIPLAIVGLFVAIPLYWLILSSFKPTTDLGDPNPIPTSLTLENYALALGRTGLPLWLLNTSIVALGTTLLGLAVCSLAAYSFARFRFRGKTVLFAIIIASISLPEFVTVIPSFIIMRSLGLLNTYWAVILPMSAHALTLFLIRQYMSQLPEDMYDALRVDGANQWTGFFRLTLPLIRPGLAAAGLMIFITSWNAYLLPLVMLRGQNLFTLPVGIGSLYGSLAQSTHDFDPWAAITAGTVISALPLVAVLLIMQRQFVSGLTEGAVR